MTKSYEISLSELFNGLSIKANHLEGKFSQITVDSRKVDTKSLFVAIRGYSLDGHSYLEDVTRKKPAAVLVEDASLVPASYKGSIVQTTSTRKMLPLLAERFFNNPTSDILVIGVTGTNGKTTSVYLLEHLLKAQGVPTGVLGTIDHHLETPSRKHTWQGELTTPGPLELQKRIREMVDLGAKAIVMEISSHALDQHRADGVQLNVGIFTNLTQDHLDYHKTMDKYFEAKSLLFERLLKTSKKSAKKACINIDDSWGAKLARLYHEDLLSFGLKKEAQIRAEIRNSGIQGITFDVLYGEQNYTLESALLGEFNVYNCLGALAALTGLGFDLKKSAEAIRSFKGVPGRMERVIFQNRIGFIDYAHTPDAIAGVTRTLADVKKQDSKFKAGRLITVFGCGGDRDKEKRPLMLEAASQYSDVVIVTSDNPRTEDPQTIIDDILKGRVSSPPNSEILSEVSRKKAIQEAVNMAHEADVILIAGKGHENYQIIGQQKREFSDKLELEFAFENRLKENS